MSGIIGANNQFGHDFNSPDANMQGIIVSIYDVGEPFTILRLDLTLIDRMRCWVPYVVVLRRENGSKAYDHCRSDYYDHWNDNLSFFYYDCATSRWSYRYRSGKLH